MLSRFCAGTYQGNELIRHTSKVVSSSLSICKPLLSENKSDIGTRKLSPLTKKKKKRNKEKRTEAENNDDNKNNNHNNGDLYTALTKISTMPFIKAIYK